MPENETATFTTAESLRLLADWYEQHPTIPGPEEVNIYLYGEKDELLAQLADASTALGADRKIEAGTYYIDISRDFSSVTLMFSVAKDRICRKVERWECPKTLQEMLDLTPEELENML